MLFPTCKILPYHWLFFLSKSDMTWHLLSLRIREKSTSIKIKIQARQWTGLHPPTLPMSYLVKRQGNRRKGKRNKLVCSFTPQMPVADEQLDQAEARAWNSMWIPHTELGDKSPNTWAMIHCLPRPVSRELHWTYSSWDSNWHYNMGSHCWPPRVGLNLLQHSSGLLITCPSFKSLDLCYSE